MTWLRTGNGWHSANTVEMVRAMQVQDVLVKNRPKTLSELFPDSEKLTQLLKKPLDKYEIRNFYCRNMRYQGNNRLQIRTQRTPDIAG